MSIKEYKYSAANKFKGDATKEIINACKFLGKQIKKGWTPEEAIEQTENQYGYLICNASLESFNRVFKKRKII